MKCPQCGLVNFKSATNCKRCNLVFDSGADPAHENAEAWRDSSHLVLRSDSFLPDRCVKCNSSTNITQKAHKLAYLPKHNLLLLLVGFIHYKAMMVPLALCSQHDSNRKKSLAAMVVMIILGLVGSSVATPEIPCSCCSPASAFSPADSSSEQSRAVPWRS